VCCRTVKPRVLSRAPQGRASILHRQGADDEIERASRAEAARWDELTGRLGAMLQPRPAPTDLTVIAERARRLAAQNDPDALRAEATAIAAALDALTPATPG